MTKRRRITVLTTGRQDWGILRSVCVGLGAVRGIELDLAVGGMHLSLRHGHTIDQIRADGFEPSVELPWVSDATDTQAAVEAATAMAAVGAHLRRVDSDALVLVGDRYETAAAALAATLGRIPIVHIHGGEQTLGAFDDALRHAITKLAHLHLVSHAEHAQRVLAMGEDPATVHVVGAPGLDAAFRADLPDRAELSADLGLDLVPPVVVVTVHPTTLEADSSATARAVAQAMDDVPATYVLTMPNVDPGAQEVAAIMRDAARPSGRVAVEALGERRYWGLLRIADAMLGNSSSGLIEAPAVGLAVVNVGDRQEGRARHGHVIDARNDAAEVAAALRRALDPARRAADPTVDSPPFDGRAGERAAQIIAGWEPSRPPRKAAIPIAP